MVLWLTRVVTNQSSVAEQPYSSSLDQHAADLDDAEAAAALAMRALDGRDFWAA